MKKKIFIYALLCVVLCSITGCAKDITPPLPISGVSTVPSLQATRDSSELLTTQLTTNVSTILSTSTQSVEGSPELLPTRLTSDMSTTLSAPTRSEKTTNSRGDTMDNACKLIVKGKELTDTNYVKLNYEYRYAELPLTTIMEELGAKVEWTGKTMANITFDKKEYILDATKGSLIEKGSTFNVLVPAPGSKHGVFCRVVDNEFVIDSDSAKMLLINIMGTKMRVDYDNRIVDIS